MFKLLVGLASDATPEEQISRFGEFLNTCLQNFLNYLPTLILAIVILVVGMIVTKLVLRMMKKSLGKGKIEATVASFSSSVIKIAMYVVIICIVLTILGVPSASIIAVIGTAGVAIGLALKDSLSNVAGGFIILFEKPFKIGDIIETNGVTGAVTKITLLYTSLSVGGKENVFIPNSQVSTAKVSNLTIGGERRVDVDFSISYDNDYDFAKKVILDVIAKNGKAIKEPEVMLSAHADSAIVITARVWVKSEDFAEMNFYLLEYVRKAFIDNQIEIPYNQLDVHIKNS